MKKETLEEFIKKAYLSRLEDCLSVDFEDGVKLGAKWQAERSYSEEEVIDLNFAYFQYLGNSQGSWVNFKEWFNLSKKK